MNISIPTHVLTFKMFNNMYGSSLDAPQEYWCLECSLLCQVLALQLLYHEADLWS